MRTFLAEKMVRAGQARVFGAEATVVPVFLMLYLGHKVVRKTRVVPLSECNFDPGAPD